MEYNLFGRQVFIVGTVFPKLPVVWGAQGPREPSGWMPALYFVIAELPYICSKLPPCPHLAACHRAVHLARNAHYSRWPRILLGLWEEMATSRGDLCLGKQWDAGHLEWGVAVRCGVSNGNASWNFSWACGGLALNQVEQEKVASPWLAPTSSAENSLTGFIIHTMHSLLMDRTARSMFLHLCRTVTEDMLTPVWGFWPCCGVVFPQDGQGLLYQGWA